MSVLVTADLHFSDNQRDNYRHEFVDILIDIMKRRKVKTLLILGDLTEAKDHHGAWLVNTVVKSLTDLLTVCPIYFLRGNHDGLDPSNPFFEFLHYLQAESNNRFVWINTPMTKKIKDLGKCLFLPHTTNYKKDWKGINMKSPDFIFCHNTFKGTQIGNAPEMDGVPTSVFPKNSRVYSGDTHVPMSLGPVEYVGSPYLVDFGDDYEPRVLLFKKQSMYSIACPGSQKRLIHAECLETEKKVRLHFGVGVRNEGDIVKVRVTVTPEQYMSWQAIRDKVWSWAGKLGLLVHSVQPVYNRGALKVSIPRIDSKAITKLDKEYLNDYATQMRVHARTLKEGYKFIG